MCNLLVKCVGTAGVTHRPDIAGEDAFLHKIRSHHATAGTSFDSTDSLDLNSITSPDAAAAAAVASMRHSADGLPMSSNDPLYAPPDFLRPVSGPAVPPGCRTKPRCVLFLCVFLAMQVCSGAAVVTVMDCHRVDLGLIAAVTMCVVDEVSKSMCVPHQ